MSLYLKYRPQKFGEVKGQEHIVQTLKNALKQGKIGHAYLLTGSRGLGKTTVARLIAKAVNCQQSTINKQQSTRLRQGFHLRPAERGFGGQVGGQANNRRVDGYKLEVEGCDSEPCVNCDSCQEIAEGRALDVLEIDAASNRGIEEIRELREKIKFAPSSFPYKVYIIDEVHMLTKEAFNALLKTLEEPPTHAIFILATTEAHKVPLTIQSRCQRLDFRRPSSDELSGHLQGVAEKEKINLSPGAARLLSDLANGSFRDGLSLLDQIAGGRQHIGDEINEEGVRRLLGLAEEKLVTEFVDCVLAKDIQAAWRLIGGFYQAGGDLLNFSQSIIGQLRRKMIESQDFQLAGIIDIFVKAANELKYSSISTLPLELAVVEATVRIKNYEV
ncbi:MAG: DNA polymerase III subunit gamma/tau [Candidatus Berkelbacteria bacterium Licking1014_2]|uniref:DNA polymerase III subunit gamma/tau n=1 Tax=Candidatus Berkelbacteria bacterium Licking1014_2 TaxID=2017146 RepID=A0A554LXE2_9BACT|nr:MAG: DNA polymerase III subunit gamma/tau [Candidatus Berkelbacteria bacterium Licking1014_2]